jgi:sugar O-acyltransferase (sialic acid O-acetyltransferase NeuD family)
MIDVVLIAAGGLAREVIASAPDGIRIVALLDDDPTTHGRTVGGLPVLGGLERIAELQRAAIVVCAGSGRARRGLVARLAEFGITQQRFATVLGTGVRVPSGCHVGAGSIVLPGAVLTADVSIGRHVVVMPNATLTHDDRVDDFATVCAGVSLGGGVHVGEAAYLGMNAGVRQHLAVGAGATLGMGGVLLEDLPAGETWAGVPARVIQARAGAIQPGAGAIHAREGVTER